jgi:hypothetical protein
MKKNSSGPVFTALIFTDNHVGYKEDHRIRGQVQPYQ